MRTSAGTFKVFGSVEALTAELQRLETSGEASLADIAARLNLSEAALEALLRNPGA